MKLDEVIESDVSDNEEKYTNLAEAVSQLDSTRRVKAPTRKEISTVVSEFHLAKPETKTGEVVNVNELTEVLRHKSASHAELRNKVKNVVNKAKTLPKPLEAPVEERIKRAVAYENVRTQLKKWNAVVTKNRVADHLSFPLKQGKLTLETTEQFFSKFTPKTHLEIEVAKILGTETHNAENAEDELNENLEFPLTLEEMMEKKKELAKIRAKLSYQEAKAHRQSKIKSKKYHRILKREKIKQQLKEFEQLQKTNPEEALKRLEELDKSRAQERASLRHKNTGKWAKNLAVRAKYNKESRKELAEQLKLSKELTAKLKNVESDDEVSDHENPVEAERDMLTSSDNPWALQTSSEVSDFVSTCKKFWENKNKEIRDRAASENSPKVTEKSSKTNESSDNIEQSSNIDTNSGVAEEPIINGVELNGSNAETEGNKSLSKGQTLSDGLCKKKKDKKVTLKGKSKKSNDNGVDKQKKLVKNKLNNNKKIKSAENAEVKIRSTSGSWTVLEVKEEKPKKRKNVKDIDDLFDDLDEKLTSETSKKLQKVKRKLKKPEKEKMGKVIEKEDSESDDVEDLSFKNKSSVRPDIDEELAETTGHTPSAGDATAARQISTTTEVPEHNDAPPEIDPNKFIQVKPKKLDTKLPDNATGDDVDYMDDDEDQTTQQMNIVEAFGDDDVMEEFEEMKKEEEEKTKLETVNALPGWGSWGGKGIEPPAKKAKETKEKLPDRKDKDKKDLIIREKTNPKLLEHMVKDVPHPFKSVGAFESNLRYPVGREWLPETAHRKFIKKPVETLMGTIIEPMDEDELLQLKKREKSLYKGKTKQKK